MAVKRGAKAIVIDNRDVKTFLLNNYGHKSKLDTNDETKPDLVDALAFETILPRKIERILFEAAKRASYNGSKLTSPHRLYFYLTQFDFISTALLTAFINGQEDRSIATVSECGINFVTKRMFEKIKAKIPSSRMNELNRLGRNSIAWDDAVISEAINIKSSGGHQTKRARIGAIFTGLRYASDALADYIHDLSDIEKMPILTDVEKHLYSVAIQNSVALPVPSEDYRKYLNSFELGKMISSSSDSEEIAKLSAYCDNARSREAARAQYLIPFQVPGLEYMRTTVATPLHADRLPWLSGERSETVITRTNSHNYVPCYADAPLVKYFTSDVNNTRECTKTIDKFWIDANEIKHGIKSDLFFTVSEGADDNRGLLPCHLTDSEIAEATRVGVEFNPYCYGCDGSNCVFRGCEMAWSKNVINLPLEYEMETPT